MSSNEQDEFIASLGAAVPALPLPGDFYGAHVDDVLRGISLPIFDEMSLSQEFDGGNLSKLQQMAPSPDDVFKHTDVAPTVSEYMKPYMEPTIQRLSGQGPVTAGNNLLSFLQEIVDARITKVNQQKFVIRAVVFLEGMSCSVKVRIYQQDQGSIVEFQRRSGDGVTFMNLYRDASRYLQAGIYADRHHISSHVRKLPEIQHTPTLPTIAPLLNMADSCRNIGLLSEVAAALNAMVEDPEVAAQLRTPCAFSVLQRLQQVDDFSVSFPTSRMLACL